MKLSYLGLEGGTSKISTQTRKITFLFLIIVEFNTKKIALNKIY